jgi:predicted metalloprotease
MSHITHIALAAGLVVGTGSLTTHDAPFFLDHPRDDGRRVTLTERDVEASNQEVAAAYSALVSMWSAEFRRIGDRFVAPRIARYRGTTRSSCGILPASNAMYCGRNNTIYFDDVFLAAQAKVTGAALGSDGDMAGVGIIAHEMGHAVTAQLGVRYRRSYDAEAAADCLAGAFAKRAQQDGSLEKGDLEEAFYAMAAAGDPDLTSTGNARLDARRAAIVARASHGTREQRQQNFRAGFSGGSVACVPELGPEQTQRR